MINKGHWALGEKNACLDLDSKTPKIWLGKKVKSPAVTAHELGHFEFYKKLYPKKGTKAINNIANKAAIGNDVTTDLLYDLSNELGASKQGMSILKKSGATTEQIKAAEKELETAYDAYIQTTAENTRQHLNFRHRGILPEKR